MERGHTLPNPYNYNLILVTSHGRFRKPVSGDKKKWTDEAFSIVHNYQMVECVSVPEGKPVLLRCTEIAYIYEELAQPI